MAKVTELITGYSDMTAEEKLAALEALEQPEAKPDPEAARLKTQLSKANSEAAEYKRKLQEKMTADEKAKAEAEEAAKQKDEELEELRTYKAINIQKTHYLAMGYDEDLAEATAKAAVEGDTATQFANEKAFLAAHDKSVLAGAVKTTPTPPAGSTETKPSKTKEEIMAIADTAERQKAIAANPELFGLNF